MDKFKKKELIKKTAHALDITPDMYNQATSVINGLTNYLKSKNIGISIYKQGSFRLGTIIKPYFKDTDGDFDIDLVVQFTHDKTSIRPQLIKTQLGEYLKAQNYRDFLEKEHGRCWTLNNNDRVNKFHIDLLPCVKEDQTTIQSIMPKELANTAIAITDRIETQQSHTYDWKTSNPEGYAKWFDSVNKGKFNQYKLNDRKRVFDSFPKNFNSADTVGDDFTRTPLQQVIQILKRHRDVAFATEDNKMKPASIIITTLVTRITETNELDISDAYDLLITVVEALKFYSELAKQGIDSNFSETFKNKSLIKKEFKNGNVYWQILNPANSGENLADKWNETPERASKFFGWVNQIQADLIDILEYKPEEIKAKFKYCLGMNIASKIFEHFSFDLSAPVSRIFNQTAETPKPYKV